MSKEKFQVLYAPKTAGVSTDEAQEALALEYPDYKVSVTEVKNQLVAKLVKKAEGGVPPFVDEKDEKPADDEGGEEKPKAEKKPDLDGGPGDDSDDDDSDDDKGDDDGGDSDSGGDDLSKALKALDALKSVLPKLEKQLHGLGGDVPGGLEGPGGPVPPAGLGGPPGGPEHVGPTPGAPPAAAGGPPKPGFGGPAGPGAVPPPPHGGPGGPPKPLVGVPTFSSNKFVYRPVANADGSLVSLAQAAEEISQHPKYAAYDVKDVKFDDESKQIVAHLKLRRE